MIKSCDVAEFYEVKPAVTHDRAVRENRFITLMDTTREKVADTYDRLAYLAGIKSAAQEDQYRTLDTSSLPSLLRSAKEAGFNAQVINI